MSKHTPGPRTIEEEKAGDGKVYFHEVCDGTGNIIEPHEGNARLVACAPLMIEVLKIARIRLVTVPGGEPVVEVIDEVLAKAEAYD